MRAQLPVASPLLTLQAAWQACQDALEHRNGLQRIPLITSIGSAKIVSDVDEKELERGLNFLSHFISSQVDVVGDDAGHEAR